MAIHLTPNQIVNSFPPERECLISYRGKKERIKGKIKDIYWKNVIAVTAKFDKPRFYPHRTEGIVTRDSVRIVVKQ